MFKIPKHIREGSVTIEQTQRTYLQLGIGDEKRLSRIRVHHALE
jgi:hypothetical protein